MKIIYTFAVHVGFQLLLQDKDEKGMPCESATVPAAVSSSKCLHHTFATALKLKGREGDANRNKSEDLPVLKQGFVLLSGKE